MIRYIFVLFHFLIIIQVSFGQELIDTIFINDLKPYNHHFLKADQRYHDSTANSIIDFLQSIPGGQMQIASPGGLTTLLHRGMGNRHLPILWNGINIQSVTNGSFDLGLTPAALFDEVHFFNSGNPALQGNNGLSGSLNLNTVSLAEEHHFIKLNLSTLQNIGLIHKYAQNSKKTQLRTGLQSSYDQNQFNYTYNRQKLERQSTHFLQINAMASLVHQFTSEKMIDIHVWWQYADRIIPVSISTAPLTQKQQDQNLRTQWAYTQYGKLLKWKTTANYIKEFLNFNTAAIDSRSEVDVLMLHTEWIEKKAQKYQFAFSHRADIANPNFYTDQKIRNTSYLSTSRNFKWSSHHFTHIAVRQDLTDQNWMPFSWTFHHHFKSWDWSVSSNYNLPGFNDLYWPEGGNPNLKTEKSLKSEWSKIFNIAKTSCKINLYTNLVDNWIQWQPNNTGRWSPINNKKVWSRGVELEATKKWGIKNGQITAHATYSFNKTTSVDHYTDPELIGKQLIYVPIHKTAIHSTIQLRKYTFKIDYSFTGIRYDQSDESGALDPIHLINFAAQRSIGKYQLGAQINNILNTNYEIVRFYPQPGLYLDISLKYTFL